jgi:hypothetical protein
MRSTAIENAVNASRKCELHPYNVNIFGDSEFIPKGAPENIGGETLNIPAADRLSPKNSMCTPSGHNLSCTVILLFLLSAVQEGQAVFCYLFNIKVET